jgi:hypothetical protein
MKRFGYLSGHPFSSMPNVPAYRVECRDVLRSDLLIETDLERMMEYVSQMI